MRYEISEEDIKSIDDSIKWLWSICREFLKEPSGDNNELSAVYALGQADREVANVYYKLSTLFEKIKKTGVEGLKVIDGVDEKSNRWKSSRVKSFIDGGVIAGPNNDLKGEYQGIENNPEVIAPLNKLKELVKDVVWNQPVDLSKSIPAEKLLIKYNRGDKA